MLIILPTLSILTIIRGAFKRNHEGNYHCTEQELKMMLRDSNETNNDDLLSELLYTFLLWNVSGRCFITYQWNSSEHKKVLTNFGGYKDRKRRIDYGRAIDVR